MRTVSKVALAALLVACPAMANTYEVVADWATINNGGVSTSIFSAAVDGQTLYAQLTGNNGSRLVRIDNLNGVQTHTELVTNAQWKAATGSVAATVTLTTMYGFSLVGDYMQFNDATTDAVWRVHKSTGAITPYVTKAQIQAYTGAGSPNLGTGADTFRGGPFAGQYVFFDSGSDSIMVTTGEGTLQTLIDTVTLQDLAGVGVTVASTGMGSDSQGNLYWGNGNSDEMYKRAPDGTITTILTPTQIKAVTGATGVGFKDIFPAPGSDGRVYWQDQTSTHVLRFDPADPAGTLDIFLSSTELLTTGPQAGTNLYTLDWYDGRLGFVIHSTTGARGFYAIPEPASLGLLTLGGLMILRRRSR